MATNSSTSTSSSARRTGLTIHYHLSYIVQGAEHGTDGALVLLHDFPSGAFAWENVMAQLTGLGRAVYAIDMLGYGQSDHPWPADTSVWGQADALSYLFQQLKLTNVILVGHGLGGAVAQILATRLYRDQTQALVLIDTLCYKYAFAENWPLTDMKKRQDFDAPKQTNLEDLIKNLRETLPQGSNDPQQFGQHIDDYVNEWNSEVGKEVLFQHIRSLIPEYINSVSTDLKVVKKPLLIIWGEQDQIVPLKYGHRLHHDVEGSQLVVIPNAAHLLLFDAPTAIANVIVNFVGGLG